MEPEYLLLTAFAAACNRPVHDLVLFASEGKLKLSAVIGNAKQNLDEGWATLCKEDILRALNNDSIMVTQLFRGTELLKLEDPIRVNLGKVYVSTDERTSFVKAQGPSVPDKTDYPFLNEDHQIYSASLDAAVRAWLHLCNDTEKMSRVGISEKQQIEKWLKEHYGYRPDFSDNLISHIAAIVNPNKRGGSPRT